MCSPNSIEPMCSPNSVCMFSNSDFQTLYSLLDGDIVEVDCGIKCQQYCCKAINTIKYLLPGEEEYFTLNSPSNFEFIDHYLFTGYQAKDRINCSCTRALRPFCCRIFPFRPIIDLETFKITGLKKASSPGFDLHCWIASPLLQWKQSAILAWQLVLDDEDNQYFYAKQAVFLKKAQASQGVSTTSLLYDVMEELKQKSYLEVWQEVKSFFDLLGSQDLLSKAY